MDPTNIQLHNLKTRVLPFAVKLRKECRCVKIWTYCNDCNVDEFAATMSGITILSPVHNNRLLSCLVYFTMTPDNYIPVCVETWTITAPFRFAG